MTRVYFLFVASALALAAYLIALLGIAVVGLVGLYLAAAEPNSAMQRCLQTHSFDTCFETLN